MTIIYFLFLYILASFVLLFLLVAVSSFLKVHRENKGGNLLHEMLWQLELLELLSPKMRGIILMHVEGIDVENKLYKRHPLLYLRSPRTLREFYFLARRVGKLNDLKVNSSKKSFRVGKEDLKITLVLPNDIPQEGEKILLEMTGFAYGNGWTANVKKEGENKCTFEFIKKLEKEAGGNINKR